MGSGIKFDEIETDIGTCFPIHVVVSVCLYESSSLTQMDSTSIIAKFLNSFCSILYGMLNASIFSKSGSQFVNIFWVIMFNTITTSNQMSFQIWKECVTRSTPEGFEQSFDVVNVGNVIVVA